MLAATGEGKIALPNGRQNNKNLQDMNKGFAIENSKNVPSVIMLCYDFCYIYI